MNDHLNTASLFACSKWPLCKHHNTPRSPDGLAGGEIKNRKRDSAFSSSKGGVLTGADSKGSFHNPTYFSKSSGILLHWGQPKKDIVSPLPVWTDHQIIPTSLNSSHVWVFAPVMTAASVCLASWYLSANWARKPLLLSLTDSIMASVQHHVVRRQPPTIFACQQLSPSATPERVQPLSIGSRTDFIHKGAVSNFWLVILHLSKALAPSMVMTKRWDSILCCQTSGNVLQLSTYTTVLVVAPCYFLRLRLSRLMDLQRFKIFCGRILLL